MVSRIIVNSSDQQEMRTFKGYLENSFQFYTISSGTGRVEVTVFGTPGELSLSLQTLRACTDKMIKEITNV